MTSEPYLVSETEAARALGLQPCTLLKWRKRGDSPLPHVRISSRAIRYRWSDVQALVERRLHGAERR